MFERFKNVISGMLNKGVSKMETPELLAEEAQEELESNVKKLKEALTDSIAQEKLLESGEVADFDGAGRRLFHAVLILHGDRGRELADRRVGMAASDLPQAAAGRGQSVVILHAGHRRHQRPASHRGIERLQSRKRRRRPRTRPRRAREFERREPLGARRPAFCCRAGPE